MNTSIATLALTSALKLARGSYQQSILRGWSRMSGADLRGKARDYSARYAESRRNLLARLTRANIPHHVATREHGRLELVLGIW